MIKFLYVALFCLVLLSSCRKNNDTIQTVNINGIDYPTAVIGNKIWTTANYRGSGGLSYNNDATNDAAFGKFYLFNEAIAITLPSGWRLPTRTDYESLFIVAGSLNAKINLGILNDVMSRRLRSTNGWDFGGGNNSLGFNAIAAGNVNVHPNYNDFVRKGQDAFFWSSTQLDTLIDPVAGKHASMPVVPIIRAEEDQYPAPITALQERVDMYPFPYDTYMFSVRFVKDN